VNDDNDGGSPFDDGGDCLFRVLFLKQLDSRSDSKKRQQLRMKPKDTLHVGLL